MRTVPSPQAFLLLLLATSCTGGNDKSDKDDTGNGDTGEIFDLSQTQTSDGGTYVVSYLPSLNPIPLSDNFSVTLSVYDASNPETLITDLDAVDIDATMPAHNHGMMVVPELSENDDGTWLAAPMEFVMGGHWEVVVDVTKETTERASFHVICCDG